MKIFSALIALFALILLSGGFMGYIKAGSLPSLTVSLIASTILFFSSYYIFFEKIQAFYLATFVIFSLHVFFVLRFLKTFSMMPAGLMVLLTTALGAPMFYYLTQRVKEKVYE
jgi:uncharacterized membrane protein (UPF0136 family)